MSRAAISIVMPTLNSEKYVVDALNSLECQTQSNFELLVCDGGSTDATLDLILEIMGERAKIVSRADKGVPDALNKGFSAAEGEILCWMNSDDVLVSRTALSTVTRFFESRKCDVAVCDSVTLAENGRVSKTLIAFAPPTNTPSAGGNIFTGSLFFSQATWKEFGKFSGQYKIAFEYELTDYLFSMFDVHKINSVVGGFRIHSAGLSSAFEKEMRAEVLTLRTGKKSSAAYTYFLNRLWRHAADANLHRVIMNYFFDCNKDLLWQQLEERGWIGRRE